MVRQLGWILIVLALCTVPAGAETRWALLVGVDRYDSSGVSPLRYPGADVRGLAKVLIENCGFAADHVIIMTSDATGRNAATSTGVLRWMEGLKAVVQPADTFLFYFSGHGVEMDKESFLLTRDAEAESRSLLQKSSLSVAEVRDALEEIRARRLIQIVDACRIHPEAGRGTRDNPLTPGLSRDLVVKADIARGTEMAATIFACKVGQCSYEGYKGHGYFTYFLMEGLRGAGAGGSGDVTLASLVDYLARTVSDAVRLQDGQRQEPWAESSGSGYSDWVMARKSGTAVAARPAAPGAPQIAIAFPPPEYHSTKSTVALAATVKGQHLQAPTVSVNGTSVPLVASALQVSAGGAAIQVVVPLVPGNNEIRVHAVTADGQSATLTRRVVLGSAPSENRATPTPQAHKPAAGSVEFMVTSSPPGALVWIDMALVGHTPATLRVSPGEHDLRLTTNEKWMPFHARIKAPGEINATMEPSPYGLLGDAETAYKSGKKQEAAALLERAAQAPGKRPIEIEFYRGLVALDAGRAADAEKHFVAFVTVKSGSPTGQYHLGRAREALGSKALAATAYKAAVLNAVGEARALLAVTGTSENQVRLERSVAKYNQPRDRLQLGHVLELRGHVDRARRAYRELFELMAKLRRVDLYHPAPDGLPLPL